MIRSRAILLTLGAALAASMISNATTTAKNQPNTQLTPAGLAYTDAVLNFCSRVDPSSSASYSAAFAIISQGHVPSELAAIRSTPLYVKTQTQINSQLSKVPAGSALSVCRAVIPR